MNEILYIVFLLSGIIKLFLHYFNIETYIDFTLLSAIIILFLVLKNLYSNNLIMNINKDAIRESILLLLLFSLILFSIYYTSSDNYIYSKIIQFLTVILAFFTPLFIKKFSTEHFFRWFIIMTLLITIIFIPLYITGYNELITNYTKLQQSPLLSITGSYLTIGHLIAIALIINMFSNSFIGKIKLFISLFLFGSLLITGARGPILGLFIVLIIFLISKKFKIKKVKLSTFFISIVLLIITSIYIVNKVDIINTFERTYDRIVNLETDASANDRITRAKFVLNKVDFHHFILGFGFGSFGYEYNKQDIRNYPHNMALEIYFELGFIGLTIYILFILRLFIHLYKTGDIFSWSLFIFLFLNSLKSLSLADSRMFFGFLAILLMYEKPDNKKERTNEQ